MAVYIDRIQPSDTRPKKVESPGAVIVFRSERNVYPVGKQESVAGGKYSVAQFRAFLIKTSPPNWPASETVD